MPRMQKVFTLDISPEQFLNNCSGTELQEIALLINMNQYQSKMRDNHEVTFEEAKKNILRLSDDKVAEATGQIGYQCRVCKSTGTENKKFISKRLCEDCWERVIAE